MDLEAEDIGLTSLGTFCRGRHLSYQRGRHTTHPGTSLIKIEGVDDTKAAKYVSASEGAFDIMGRSSAALTAVFCSFYLGKKIAYVYRGQKEKRGTKLRVIWGKVTRPHGECSPGRVLGGCRHCIGVRPCVLHHKC